MVSLSTASHRRKTKHHTSNIDDRSDIYLTYCALMSSKILKHVGLLHQSTLLLVTTALSSIFFFPWSRKKIYSIIACHLERFRLRKSIATSTNESNIANVEISGIFIHPGTQVSFYKALAGRSENAYSILPVLYRSLLISEISQGNFGPRSSSELIRSRW